MLSRYYIMNVKDKVGKACRTGRHEEISIMAFPSTVEAAPTVIHKEQL